MENEQLTFRTAAFGGFQKQDVLNYLEKSAKDHAEAVAALKRELEESKAAQDAAAQQLLGYQGQAAELSEENERLTGELAGREEELDLVRKRSEALETQLIALQEELERLRPEAEAYEGLKDRAASIELEAHTRAQAIEEAGRRKAQKLRQELLTWVNGLERHCTELSTGVDQVLSEGAQEILELSRALGKQVGTLKSSQEKLKAIREQVDAMEPAAPMPLTEGKAAAPQPPEKPLSFSGGEDR